MFSACYPLILASASPRRKDLLSQLGIDFHIVPATIDETPFSLEAPIDFVRRMAVTKAEQVATDHPQACVIGADTVVTLDHHIFGKPRDYQDALAMLTSLQGQTHAVITGYAIVAKQHDMSIVEAVTTAVTFGTFNDAILRAYVQTGEPMDKAGAYGIQGIGGFLVHEICGSYSNVVGLPLHAVVQTLLKWRCIQPRNSGAPHQKQLQ
jgi:septum formation protein